MYVVERTCDGAYGEKSTIVAETKELLLENLADLFYDWFDPRDRNNNKGIKVIDNTEEDYDWDFDKDYLLGLEGGELVKYFSKLSSVEDFNMLYGRDMYISVNLYRYEDEDTGEIVYDTESIQRELGKQFYQKTGKDWMDY